MLPPITSPDNKYELLSPIGRGGMGLVYRARLHGPGGVSKQVALKLVHSHLTQDQEFVFMFIDEMRVAMAMAHRNIVQTFDAGKIDEHYFMVMELIEGCSLQDLLSQIKGKQLIPLELALFIGMELSAALAYAHNFQPSYNQPIGIVHRDVTPSNILLSLQGDVKLADFGIAKVAGRKVVTQNKNIKGKLRYMAPEQALGKVSPRSDLYSLGAVIYEMLVGKPIRPGRDLDEIHQSREDIPPPSASRSGISSSLDALVLRCLHWEVDQRPSNAQELREALARETFNMQMQQGSSLDPHSCLCSFLSTWCPIPPERDSSKSTAQRLAQAVLKEIDGVEADSAFIKNDAELTPSFLSNLTGKSNPCWGTQVDILPDNGANDQGPTEVNFTIPAWSIAQEFKNYPSKDARREPLTEIDSAVSSGKDDVAKKENSIQVARTLHYRWYLVVLIGVTIIGTFSVWLSFRLNPSSEVDVAGQLHKDGATYNASEGKKMGKDFGIQPEQKNRRNEVRHKENSFFAVDLGAVIYSSEARPTSHAVKKLVSPRRRLPIGPKDLTKVALSPGYLDINSNPWVKVIIDGKQRGETPLEDIMLSPGRHQLRLINSQFQISRTYIIHIKAGQRLKKIIEFK